MHGIDGITTTRTRTTKDATSQQEGEKHSFIGRCAFRCVCVSVLVCVFFSRPQSNFISGPRGANTLSESSLYRMFDFYEQQIISSSVLRRGRLLCRRERRGFGILMRYRPTFWQHMYVCDDFPREQSLSLEHGAWWCGTGRPDTATK